MKTKKTAIILVDMLTEAFTEEDYNYGLDYLKNTYGATITNVTDLIKEF